MIFCPNYPILKSSINNNCNSGNNDSSTAIKICAATIMNAGCDFFTL